MATIVCETCGELARRYYRDAEGDFCETCGDEWGLTSRIVGKNDPENDED